MLSRRFILKIFYLVIALLHFSGLSGLRASDLSLAFLYPAAERYKEDINQDGVLDVSDAITLLLLGVNIPDSPKADYNDDGVYNILDVVKLLVNIRDKKLTLLNPLDTTLTDSTAIDTTATDTTATDTTATKTTYVLSGMVFCAETPLFNVSMIMLGDKEATTHTDAAGMYFFQVPNGHYTIVPSQIGGYAFNPISYDVIVSGSDVKYLNFFVYGYESLPGY
ncbi:MAG TPA: hypothetical protein VM123_11225 [archaeon]|nr:hypothetical protein [archaeon]